MSRLAEELAEKWSDTGYRLSSPSVVTLAISEAVSEAIERCAKAVEAEMPVTQDWEGTTEAAMCERIAARIRSL